MVFVWAVALVMVVVMLGVMVLVVVIVIGGGKGCDGGLGNGGVRWCMLWVVCVDYGCWWW